MRCQMHIKDAHVPHVSTNKQNILLSTVWGKNSKEIKNVQIRLIYLSKILIKSGIFDGHDYLWLWIICDYHNFDQFGLSVMFLNLYKIQFVLSVTIGNVMITDNPKVCRIILYHIRLNILLFLKRTSWEILKITHVP